MIQTLHGDVTAKHGYNPQAVSMAEAMMAEDTLYTLPNKPLYKIIDGIEDDESLNYSFQQYYLDYKSRQKITSLAELKEWDKTHPRYNYGNVTPEQYKLLLEYEALNKNERKQFLGDHPELSVNPREQWLRDNPQENARLAVWGQSKLLTSAAYNAALKLVKELDIPQDAVSKYLPPKDVAEDSYKYYEILEQYGANSAEARLLGLDNPKLFDWLGRDSVTDNRNALELTIKNRGLQAEYDALSATEDVYTRQQMQEDFRQAHPEWRDDTRRIEAYTHNADDKTADLWAKRGQVADQSSPGSAEAKLFLADNPELHRWALENKLLTDDGADWDIPVLRIDAKYRQEDAEYNALTDDASRAEYLNNNPAYAVARKHRDGYRLGLTDSTVKNAWTEYYSLPETGHWRERYLVDNPDFFREVTTAQQAKGQGVWQTPDPAKIPDVQYDLLTEKWQAVYDQLDAVSKSPGTESQRKARREAILAEAGPEFMQDDLRRAAYGLMFPPEYIEDYVNYYSLPATGYADDRYLKDHPEFYAEMKARRGWQSTIDFAKVPSARVEMLYEVYRDLPSSGKQREAFRKEHPDLDAWMIKALGYSPLERVKIKNEETAFIEQFATASALADKIRNLR
jgi:hypothetical protein